MSCHWLSYLYELHMALSVKCYMNMHESLEAVAKGFTSQAKFSSIKARKKAGKILEMLIGILP